MNLPLNSRSGPARSGPALGAVLLTAAVLAGCGSSSHSSTADSVAKAPPINSPCQQIQAVLSDGPDPSVDPVGYAQAQVLQLRKLHLDKPALAGAVSHLASAYQQFSQSNGSSNDKLTVKAAVKAVNTICPGAAG
jgi:hypothetical protein